jgi:hypothetical protein
MAVAGDDAHHDAFGVRTRDLGGGMSRYQGARILSLAGRFSQSWKPSMRPSSCSGISLWMTPRPAVIHCTPPPAMQAFVAGAVAVAHAALEHVGHGLEAAVRVVGEAADVVARVVGAEGVEHQEGVEPVDLLGEGFDIAVRTGTLPDDALLAARRLAVFPIGLYAAPGYLDEHGDPLTPDDLLRHETLGLLGRDGTTRRWNLNAGNARWEGRPAGRAKANSPEILIRLAVAGVGIAAVPDCFAAPGVVRGELRRVLPDWSLPAHTAWAVFPGRRLMPTKTRIFIDMLETALSGAPGNIGVGAGPGSG